MSNTQGFQPTKASLASSTQGVLLSPTSDPRDSASFSTTRKRKRARTDGEFCFGEPFFVQAHPSLPSPKPQPLTPTLLLHRSCLPLAYLDPIGGGQDQSGSRLFTANIGILEKDVPEDASSPPRVLIAQSTVDDKLWAVERVQIGIYALCGLNTWVTLKMLERLQGTAGDEHRIMKQHYLMQTQRAEEEWWSSAAVKPQREVETGVGNLTNATRTGEFALCLQRPIQNSPPESQIMKQTPSTVATGINTALEAMADEVSQGPQEVFNMIRSQYQEALYASKTSLAYFAKGPLSRARAAFRSHDASIYDQSLLVQFLRSNILSLATMDTKYRETLPNLVRDLPFGTISDDEGASMIAAIAKKTHRIKKTKIGRNGLHAGEEVHVTRWWIGRDISSIACDTLDAREDATNATLVEQRARETQLQIILILETLALEASAPESSIGRAAQEDPPDGAENSQKKSKKPKKLQDLDTVLDLLADRLCIWQSMSTDESKTSSADKGPSSEHDIRMPTSAVRNDHLRQFCVDVVLPFYGARIPKLTPMLCNKLGGQKQPSPKRPTLAKAASSIVSQSSGASMPRDKSRKPRRTLERVLTDERSASQRPPPSLSRSVTEPVLPQLKREESNTPLSSIPLNKVALHKRYSQREVDLHKASRATEAKFKRKAKVEQELQSAIATLKKPNPRMAVKELVEDAEQRVAGSHPRKSKNPIRNPFAQGVQVMATPSKNRHNDVFANPAGLSRSFVAAEPAPQVVEYPQSGTSTIADSTRKRRAPPTSITKTLAQTCKGSSKMVEQTPTRGPSKVLGRPPASVTMDEDPVGPCRDSSSSQPPTTALIPTLYPSSYRPRDIQGTPSKARQARHTDCHADVPSHQASTKTILPIANSVQPCSRAGPSTYGEQERSIYASLGWDDDIDDLA